MQKIPRNTPCGRPLLCTRHLCLLLLLLAVLAFAFPPVASADGTEMLGAPGITLDAGTRIVGSGTGLAVQPSTINFEVPANATVQQVLLYWNGFDSAVPPSTITVNGTNTVTGTLIGGPTQFFQGGISYTFRADITALNVVTPGINDIVVDDRLFSTANNGASVLVIVDEGEPDSFLGLVDGQDLAYANFAAPLQSTEPQTFTFAPEPDTRQAEVTIVAGSVAGSNSTTPRPSIVRVTSGGVVTDFDDLLNSGQGDEWDHHVITVDVPAGAATLTVQLLSEDCCATGYLPASFAWIAGAITLAPLPAGSIGDTVYCDLNDNGIEDPGEPGQVGVHVTLTCVLPDGNTRNETTVTDVDGHYLFDSVPAGSLCTVALDTASVPAGTEVGSCPTEYSAIPVTAGSTFHDADFCVRFPIVPGVQNIIWVPNTIDNTITAIQLDGSTDGSLVAPGLLRPVAIAVKPDGTVVVAFADSDTVVEFNPGGTILHTHAVGDQPRGLAVDSQGNIWISNFADNTLMKISSSGQMLLGPGGLDGGPVPIAAAPVGIGIDALDNVYVVSQSLPTLTKLNAAGAVLAAVQLPAASDPFDLVLDRAGYVWLTLRATGVVERRASDLTLTESFTLPGATPEGIVIRGRAEAWVTGTADGRLHRLRSGELPTNFAVGITLGGLLVDGEGFVWVTDLTTAQMQRFNGEGIPDGTSFTGLAPDFIGDATGLVPANVLLPLSDFDADGFANAVEIDTFSSPLDAAQLPPQQPAFVPPVESIACTVNAQITTLTWTLPATANYMSIAIVRDGTTIATLPGTATSYVGSIALSEGVYSYEVIASDAAGTIVTPCVAVVGGGQIDGQQTILVGGLPTNLFDITTNPAPAPGQPRFYLTDPANGKIYGTDGSYNVLITLTSPFIGFAPTTGIAFNESGNGGLGSLLLGAGPNGDPDQNATVIEIALDGTVLTGPLEITIPVQPFGGQQTLFQKGGISSLAREKVSKVFLASSPLNCELFSFKLASDRPVPEEPAAEGPSGPGPGTVDLIPAASATHPQPAYGLNGIYIPDFMVFDETGGRVWVTNRAASGAFEIREMVITNGQATIIGDPVPLAAATAENSFGGFSLSGDEFAIVGLTTSTVYELGSAFFVRGDADPTGIIDVGDSIRILAACFQGQAFTSCIDAYDFDDSGTVGIGDTIALLAYLFSGGTPPSSPFPEAGADPSPDDLPCL